MNDDDSSNSHSIAEIAFKSSLHRKRRDDLQTDAVSTIENLISRFEDAAQIDADGVEYWRARELQKLLRYADYRNFLAIVSKAMDACRNSGQEVKDHFVEVNEMVGIGSNAERQVADIRLTRYASYLVAQNGDSRKTEVAFAQTYFAIQTRKQEVAEHGTRQTEPLTEDHKRLLLRDEIKSHNKNLASAAKGAGVLTPLDFALFQNFGYKGLYGGLDKSGIQRRKGLKSKENPLDHMGSTELAANLFRATQTEDKLRREETKGKLRANNVHYDVGKKVRQTIRELGGTMPEHLPAAENIDQVAKKLKRPLVATLASGKARQSE